MAPGVIMIFNKKQIINGTVAFMSYTEDASDPTPTPHYDIPTVCFRMTVLYPLCHYQCHLSQADSANLKDCRRMLCSRVKV